MEFEPASWSICESAPPGAYGLWWPAPEDPLFAASPARESIGRAYRALDGLEFSFLQFLLESLNLAGDRFPNLPECGQMIPVRVAQGPAIVLAISREKGLKFHFDKAATAIAYRNEFLKAFAEFAENWREAQRASPAGWWAHCEEASLCAERVNPPVSVGTILIRGDKA